MILVTRTPKKGPGFFGNPQYRGVRPLILHLQWLWELTALILLMIQILHDIILLYYRNS